MLLKEKVRTLPSTPGVYLMKDSEGRVIYVGKAKNLKRRVQSYFHQSSAHPQKIKKMLSNLKDFDYVLTGTEFEAFMLECYLIKDIKPLFNKKMKSPHSYVFVVIHTDEELHRIEITKNTPKKEGKRYFGPFVSRRTVETAILAIKESNQILCSSPSNKNSACLNYSLHLCIGMCLGGGAVERHNSIMNKVIALLNGTDLKMIEEMERKMAAAAERFDFETAAKIRNQIEDITFLLKKEKVIEFTKENKNIVIIEDLMDSTYKFFLIKRNKILYSETFSCGKTTMAQLSDTVQSVFITESNAPLALDLNKDELDEAQIIYSYLENSDANYVVIRDEWLEQNQLSAIEEAVSSLLSAEL